MLIYFHILDMHFLFLCFTYNTFERPANTAIRKRARFTAIFTLYNCQTRDYAILQVKVQKQPTKVANLPLWLENILFDRPAAIKRNDGTV